MNLHAALRVALWPFSVTFGVAIRLRGWLYRRGVCRPRRLNGVVVSVGNLTVGGTGKTPMVIWIARRLQAEGKPTGILTRGYRSVTIPTDDDSRGVARGERVSDEVVVLKSHLGEQFPIGVGANRFEEGRRLEQRGVQWFVLDDGFQHLRLARDLDIVLVDSTDAFGSGYLLPAGRLREPQSALARADIVVITRSDSAPALECGLRRYTPAPIFYAQTELTSLLRIFPEPVAPATDNERAAKIFAFCGTGNPNAFFDDLRRWGMKVVGEGAFPDHHLYSQRNVDQLERFAHKVGAEGLLCTEKDILNFSRVCFHSLPVYVCRIALRPLQPEEFWREVLSTIEHKRAGVAQ